MNNVQFQYRREYSRCGYKVNLSSFSKELLDFLTKNKHSHVWYNSSAIRHLKEWLFDMVDSFGFLLINDREVIDEKEFLSRITETYDRFSDPRIDFYCTLLEIISRS